MGGGFPAGIAPIDPLSLAGLQHYFKSGYTTDTDAGSLVVSSYPALSSVNDLGSAAQNQNTCVAVYGKLVDGLNILDLSAGTGAVLYQSPYNYLLNGITTFSMLLAFNIQDLTATEHSIVRWFGTNSNNMLYVTTVTDGKVKVQVRDGSGNYVLVNSVNSYRDANWHFIAVTFNASTKTLDVYLDSAEHLTNNNPGMTGTITFYNNTQRHYLGANSTWGSVARTEFLKSYVSDWQFYNNVLSNSTLNGLKKYMSNRLGITFNEWT